MHVRLRLCNYDILRLSWQCLRNLNWLRKLRLWLLLDYNNLALVILHQVMWWIMVLKRLMNLYLRHLALVLLLNDSSQRNYSLVHLAISSLEVSIQVRLRALNLRLVCDRLYNDLILAIRTWNYFLSRIDELSITSLYRYFRNIIRNKHLLLPCVKLGIRLQRDS